MSNEFGYQAQITPLPLLQSSLKRIIANLNTLSDTIKNNPPPPLPTTISSGGPSGPSTTSLTNDEDEDPDNSVDDKALLQASATSAVYLQKSLLACSKSLLSLRSDIQRIVDVEGGREPTLDKDRDLLGGDDSILVKGPKGKEVVGCLVPVDLLDLVDTTEPLNPELYSRELVQRALHLHHGLRRRKISLMLVEQQIASGIKGLRASLEEEEREEEENEKKEMLEASKIKEEIVDTPSKKKGGKRSRSNSESSNASTNSTPSNKSKSKRKR